MQQYLSSDIKVMTEKLQKKTVVTLSIIITIPMIILAGFFILLFSLAIQNYIDQYVNKISDYASAINNEFFSKSIDYINKNFDVNLEYIKLKDQIFFLQVKFFITFTYISLLTLLIVIHISSTLTKKIFKPIIELIANSIKLKNLSIKLKHTKIANELDILTAVFNQIIQQHQSKNFTIVQETSVWFDIIKRVAHEINNPLTLIQLSANIIADKFGREVNNHVIFTKYLNSILRHTEYAKNIIKGFSDFAEMPVPKFTKCDLVIVIKESIELRQIINKKIKYEFISTLSTLNFVADITQINQIIFNLLNNAEESLKAKNNFTKIIKILLQHPSPDVVIIEVQDTGGGFSLDLINNITKQYATMHLRSGGLGLSIVKKIVEDHFGTLKIKNLPHGGASVQVKFDCLKLQTCLNQDRE
ncbi:sensor histidine kinase [Candidatus Orientia mediorientalis]|nr:ATP-binding protein [Candidatus Orientia mediorientalis]